MPTKTRVWVVVETKATYTGIKFDILAIFKNEEFAKRKFQKVVDALTNKKPEKEIIKVGEYERSFTAIYETKGGIPSRYNIVEMKAKLMI